MSTAHIELIGQLGRHRWAIALIASLAASNGGRFVELLHKLGTSRESLARTLEAAIEAGWVQRNPGHGHPLRPEYILTDAGRDAARLCQSVESAQSSIALPRASLTRWSLPVLHIVDQGQSRFNAIARALPQSNPRSLTQSVKSLIGQQLLDRRIVDAFPPIPEYHLSDRGKLLARAIA